MTIRLPLPNSISMPPCDLGSIGDAQLHGLATLVAGNSWTVGGTRESGSAHVGCDAWKAGSVPDHAALYGEKKRRVKFPENKEKK